MSYRNNFEGATKEEALEKAKSFAATLDMVQQPYVYGPWQERDRWVAVVEYYGFD